MEEHLEHLLWIDFSGTDVGVSLEVEDIDVSALTMAMFSLIIIKIGELMVLQIHQTF